VILRRRVGIFAERKRNQGLRECGHLAKGEVAVPDNGRQKVQRTRKIPGAEGKVPSACKGIGQPVLFPENRVVRADLFQEVVQNTVGSEKTVRS